LCASPVWAFNNVRHSKMNRHPDDRKRTRAFISA
jgi:hypothetical protein